MITSLRNSPSVRQNKSSVVIQRPRAGGNGYFNNLGDKKYQIQFQSELNGKLQLTN